MRVDPGRAGWPDRDCCLLSKRHACPVWQAALAERGYFDRAHVGTSRRIGSIPQGHLDMHETPGNDVATGPLGQGSGVGLIMPLNAKLLGTDYRVYGALW
jgi:transketolase